MTIQIHDTGTDGAVLQRIESGASLYLDRTELVEVLEGLARMTGYTLVDRVERAALLSFADEVDDDENVFPAAIDGWVHWQNLAGGLASAIRETLRATHTEED